MVCSYVEPRSTPSVSCSLRTTCTYLTFKVTSDNCWSMSAGLPNNQTFYTTILSSVSLYCVVLFVCAVSCSRLEYFIVCFDLVIAFACPSFLTRTDSDSMCFTPHQLWYLFDFHGCRCFVMGTCPNIARLYSAISLRIFSSKSYVLLLRRFRLCSSSSSLLTIMIRAMVVSVRASLLTLATHCLQPTSYSHTLQYIEYC